MFGKNFTALLLVVAIAIPIHVEAQGLKGTFTAVAETGYFWSGDVRLDTAVRLTGIAYDTDGLTLRAARGHRIQDGFPRPLRLVLTQKSAPTRTQRFGRRIEFTHTDIAYSGRYASIRHSTLSKEQSKDLRRIGEDIRAGDIFRLYVYEQAVRRRDTSPESERSPEQPQEQPPPDRSQTLYHMEFTLGWNPTPNHKYLYETRDYGDTASPRALSAEEGTEVEINRIACDDTEAMRLISYEGDLRDVLPRQYALKIRKVWQTTSGWRHLRVLTPHTAVRVERFGDGSVLIVPKSIGSWTPEPNSPNRQSYYQTIGGICANTVGSNGSAYIQLVVTETVQRAPRSPYVRKLTRLWGELKKQ